MKSMRKSLSADFICDASRAITDTLINIDDVKNAECIMIYLSSFNEPDTFGLLNLMQDSGKKIIVPVSDTDTFTITPSLITSVSDLIRGAYGIYEPSEIIPVHINEIDVALIPGIAFSKNRDRLGFGKGYYDRFLAEFTGTKIGIGYDFQIRNNIPVSDHDVKMDLIVTEKRIYR